MPALAGFIGLRSIGHGLAAAKGFARGALPTQISGVRFGRWRDLNTPCFRAKDRAV